MKLETAPTQRLKRDLNSRLQHTFHRHASRIAIDTTHTQISYLQLEAWVESIIEKTIDKLPAQGARVVVLAEHAEEYTSAMLALFRIGALYVPMDPKAPLHRTQQILEDAEPHLVLHQKGQALPTELDTYPKASLPSLDEISSEFERTENLKEQDSNQPAYLFYTSGSTGKPKGIVGKLSSLDHFVDWETQEFDLGPSSKVSQFTTPTFDAFLRDALVPLSVGGTLCIPPDRPTAMGSDMLWQWLEEQEVSLVHCVPSLFATLLEGDWKSRNLPRLKQVLLAGEALALKHAKDWLQHWDSRIELINLYGSTETTMVKLFHRIQLTDLGKGFIPVGKGMPETDVFVLNDSGKLCEPGQIGEIHVATDHRTLGYFNQPEATEKAFKKTPFSRSLAYASGDLGTMLPDGNLRLMGRKDRQLKIGGVRIEPEEIERALLSLPNIQACAVRMLNQKHSTGNLIAKEAIQKSQTSTSENQILAAYLVLKQEAKESELREQLESLLPSPAIPRSFFSVNELPRNSNGKTDYHQLPHLSSAIPIRDYPFVEVSTETETRVRDLWVDVLGMPHVGRLDSFFSLGGDSLKAMQVMNQLRNQHGYDCRPTEVLKLPILKNFCELLDQNTGERHDHLSRSWQEVTESSETSYPLTPAQKGLWFLWKMDPKSAYYTCQGIIHLKGRFDPDAFRHAWGMLLERHEILRVRFGNVSGKPIQHFHDPEIDWDIPEDLSYLDENEAIVAIRDYAKKDGEAAFDLEGDSLLRSRLFFINEDHHALQLTMHEITIDLWAIRIMMNDLSMLYQKALNGDPVQLAPQSPNFRQFVQWQEERNSFTESQESYWKDQLDGELPVLDFTLDRSRTASPSYQGKTVHKLLSPELTTKLKHLSQSQGNTLYVTLLTGFFWMLKRYTGQEDIIIGSPLAQRDRSENEHLMGFFLNMLPLRQQLNPDDSLHDLLQSTRTVVNGALEASDYPFTQILEWAKSARDTSISPVFQVMFNMLSYSDPALECDDFSLDYESLETGHTKYDFSLYAQEYGDRLFLQIAYQTELFDEATIQRFLDNLETFYESMPSCLEQPLYSIPSIAPSEKSLISEATQGTRKPFDLSQPLIEQFEAQVITTPDVTALFHRDEQLSFGELNSLANQLALRLQESKLEPGIPIGIHIHRSFDMVAAVLSCLKVNRPFIYLDPQYPHERRMSVAEEVGLTHLICESKKTMSSFECVRIPVNEDHGGDPLDATIQFPKEEAQESLFSIVYTSASTGQPKGVRITQSALKNRFQWMWEAYPFRGDDVMLLQKPLSLVASSWECLGGLLQGVPTVIADHEDVIDPGALTQLCNKHKVSRIYGSPALFKGVIEQREKDSEAYASLKLAFTSAEPISTAQVHEWIEAFPQTPLYNLYGSSECSSNAMEFSCHNLSPESTRVPLGSPLPNIFTYVLDDRMQPVPLGVVGELCIGGACLADGYHLQDQETSAKFVTANSPDLPKVKLYKTGDLVKLRPDKLIEYHGRNDFQVKVRGFRIEPGEIENTLNEFPAVDESVVLVQDNETGGNQLVAFIAGNQLSNERYIRKELRLKLPDYMIPSRIIVVDELPRNASGKIDRKALSTQVSQKDVYVSLKEIDTSSLESTLLTLWKKHLQRTDIQLNDNFFDVGGHSMLAAQLFVEIEKVTGRSLPVSTLYRSPSIAELIQFIEEDSADPNWSTIVPIRRSGNRTPLICVTPWDGNAIYFRSLPKYLSEDQPIFSLEPLDQEGRFKEFDSLDQLIETYLYDLRAQLPEGPINLCGFSGGGVIALEIARKLKEEGRTIEGLYFFDTSFPGYKATPHGFTPAELRRMKIKAHWHAFRKQKGLKKLGYIFETLAIKLRHHLTHESKEEAQALQEENKAMWNNRKHFRLYSAAPYDGKITLLKAKDRRLETILDPTMGWTKHSPCDIEIIEVPGGHNTMLLDPNDRMLCSELEDCLNRTQKGET